MAVVRTLPDGLVDEVVRVSGSKHGDSGACWDALLEADEFGVHGKHGGLVDILN